MMENEMAVVEQTVKIKFEKVKVETVEINSGSFGVEQNPWGLAVKGYNDENTDGIDLHRIKNEHSYVDAWNNEEVLEVQEEKIKMEEDLDCKQFEATYFTGKVIIKIENDCDSFRDANTEIILNSAPKRKIPRSQRHVIRKKASRRSYSCYNCNYIAFHKLYLMNHMQKHNNRKSTYLPSSELKTCMHCNAIFKHYVDLDEHTIENHPDFIASVSRKMHECTYCTYKTTLKYKFGRHMLTHTRSAESYKLNTCIHCDATFNNKRNLDEHTIRIHPDFIASVSSKIHECTHCTYKTTLKCILSRHLLKHGVTVGSYKLSICIHCNAKFKTKNALDNHTIREHPNFIASVSSKLHECIHCTFKTIVKRYFAAHMLKHSETVDSYRFRICIYCNAKFINKQNLDEHTIRNHPDYIASVTRKMYECTHCTFKTTLRSNISRHMLKHPETVDSFKLSTCIHCDMKFKSKQGLDDHTIREHPNFIASVSSKLHECKRCTYKTTLKSSFSRHLLKHPETVDRFKLSTCIHCDMKFKSKRGLDDHTIREHPNFIASVTSKLHECAHCTYKTTLKSSFSRHMLKHPSICTYKTKRYSVAYVDTPQDRT